jgi:hypothetical protein
MPLTGLVVTTISDIVLASEIEQMFDTIGVNPDNALRIKKACTKFEEEPAPCWTIKCVPLVRMVRRTRR